LSEVKNVDTLTGLGVLIIIGVIVVTFSKHLQRLDLQMRGDAVRAARVEPLGNGLFAVYEPRPVGFLRWGCDVRIESHGPAVLPVPQTSPLRVDGQAVATLAVNPRLANAIDVVRQSMQFPGAGSDQLVPAQKFSGSPNTWQDGVNFLVENFGVVAMVGRGTYCGPRYGSVRHLYQALTIPLPHSTEGQGSG